MMVEQCPEHDYIVGAVKKIVPRWVFVGAVSCLIVSATAFCNWHMSSLLAFEEKISTKHNDTKIYLIERINNSQIKYSEDIAKISSMIKENKVVLNQLRESVESIKIKQGKLSAKQDLVLNKIGLNGYMQNEPRN